MISEGAFWVYDTAEGSVSTIWLYIPSAWSILCRSSWELFTNFVNSIHHIGTMFKLDCTDQMLHPLSLLQKWCHVSISNKVRWPNSGSRSTLIRTKPNPFWYLLPLVHSQAYRHYQSQGPNSNLYQLASLPTSHFRHLSGRPSLALRMLCFVVHRQIWVGSQEARKW